MSAYTAHLSCICYNENLFICLFVYFRDPGTVDPPYEPTPLHLVTRLRSLRGKPYWEKDIMKRFGLIGVSFDLCSFVITKIQPTQFCSSHLWWKPGSHTDEF